MSHQQEDNFSVHVPDPPQWTGQFSQTWEGYRAAVFDFVDGIIEFQNTTHLGPRSAIFLAMEATGTSALQVLESFPDADKSSLRDFENALLNYGLHNPQNTEGQDESSSDSEQEYSTESTPPTSSLSNNEHSSNDDTNDDLYSDNSFTESD
jgi:hypothetical protein